MFVENLTQGPNSTVGGALARAKQRYLMQERPLNYYDEKVLIEKTLYGLPMLRLNTPPATTSGEIASTTSMPVESPVNGGVINRSVSSQLASNLTVTRIDHTLPAVSANTTSQGTFYDLNGQVLSRPNEPLQPLFWDDLTSWSGPAHGVVLLSAAFQDQAGFDPVIAAGGYLQASTPSNEPEFSYPGPYPELPHHINARNTLDDRHEETFVFSVGQFDSTTNVERIYNAVSIDVYHSPTADDAPPQLGAPVYLEIGNQIRVTVPVSDTSGVLRVVATYTTGGGSDGHGTWQSVELAPETDNQWGGTLPITAPAWFFVQAVDVAGNVAASPMLAQLVERCYDVTGDNQVTANDLVAVASRWGQAATQPFDVDGNGVVNIVDIGLITAHWNQVCQ
jgi:hypothetical protein